jgi:hypothetical protein
MDIARLGGGSKKQKLGFIHSYKCWEVWNGRHIDGGVEKAEDKSIALILPKTVETFHYADPTKDSGDIPLF